MMKLATLPHERGPLRCIAACVAVLCCTLAVLAQPAEQPTMWNASKEIMAYVIVLAAAGSIIFNVIWSFFNRKNYDKLKETIADQKELLESREGRIENSRLMAEGVAAKHQLELNEVRATVERLRISNEAVVAQNLQMRAIIKSLENEGKWQNDGSLRLHISDG